jgi:hypothetical protein
MPAGAKKPIYAPYVEHVPPEPVIPGVPAGLMNLPPARARARPRRAPLGRSPTLISVRQRFSALMTAPSSLLRGDVDHRRPLADPLLLALMTAPSSLLRG